MLNLKIKLAEIYIFRIYELVFALTKMPAVLISNFKRDTYPSKSKRNQFSSFMKF